MTRQEARHFLLEIMFQMEINKDFDDANILKYMSKKNNRGQELYLSTNSLFHSSSQSIIKIVYLP